MSAALLAIQHDNPNTVTRFAVPGTHATEVHLGPRLQAKRYRSFVLLLSLGNGALSSNPFMGGSPPTVSLASVLTPGLFEGDNDTHS